MHEWIELGKWSEFLFEGLRFVERKSTRAIVMYHFPASAYCSTPCISHWPIDQTDMTEPNDEKNGERKRD